MNRGGRIVNDMGRLLAVFGPLCADRDTMSELEAMLVGGLDGWSHAHALFSRIRAKTNAAAREQDRRREVQYLFEEICAKTLYNLSGRSAPFDPDSPYWIVPNAFALARVLGLSETVVLEIVAR